MEDRRTPFRIGIEHAIIPQFVGQNLGALGSAAELGVNLFHEHQALMKGFDPRTAIGHVEGIQKNIHDLFAERDKLLQEVSGRIPVSHMQLAKEQGVVLQDLCNLSLHEYAEFHIGARRFRAFQDSLYLLDIFRNMSGAAGNIVAMYATEKARSTANGPAGLGTTTSAAFVIGGPIFSRLTGKFIGMYTEHQLKNLVEPNETGDLEKLQTDRTRLAQLLKQAQQSNPAPDVFFTKALELDSFNELSTQSHRKKLTLATNELRAGTRSATENLLAGTIIGGTKLCPGIGLMIGGFHFWKHGIESNILICDGNIAYLCGTSLAVADNARIQLRSELERRKLMKDRLLPGQILGDHLKKLDEIEHQLVLGTKSSGMQ